MYLKVSILVVHCHSLVMNASQAQMSLLGAYRASGAYNHCGPWLLCTLSIVVGHVNEVKLTNISILLELVWHNAVVTVVCAQIVQLFPDCVVTRPTMSIQPCTH